MSEGKGFTFDYEGKVISIAGKPKDRQKVLAMR